MTTTGIHPSIFRAYDIRGVVGDTLTTDSVFLIGKAIGSLIRDAGESQVIIARDGRLSGPVLSKALSDGLCSVGCDVFDLGMVPTPLLYFATHTLSVRSGIMLTGSHNPPDYNGLKMVINNVTLSESAIAGLYQRICDKHFYEGQGKYQTVVIVDDYLKAVTQSIKLTRPLNIVVDAGNGVAGMLAPTLFRALGCDVTELFCDVDGHFPHHHPDPSDPHNLADLAKAVREQQADVGLAFDGDGDRLGMVTSRGDVVCPDRMLMVFARAVLAKQPGAKIIYDVKCTNHLATLILAQLGEPIIWKTGHSLIKAKMAETNALLAGEMSGHFFFKDRWFGFDDALYAGARLLEILSEHTESSGDVFSVIPDSINTPELKVFVADEEKFALMQLLADKANFAGEHEMMTIDGLRVNFIEGWGLVRPSNTTPYLILRFEAINQAMLEKIQTSFREWMLSVRPDLALPF